MRTREKVREEVMEEGGEHREGKDVISGEIGTGNNNVQGRLELNSEQEL